MKSIKEFNTSGMSLFDREGLFKETEPIPIDSIVYEAGGPWEYTKQVKVTENNQKEISMFWNSVYFDNESDADIKTSEAHADYSEFMDREWLDAFE